MEADPLSQSPAPHRAPAGLRPLASAAFALLAGGVLRVWMLHKFFEVNGDSQIYGGLARNLLLHGQYAISGGDGALHSTLIRLPGYPMFLAACFRLFGMEHYRAVVWVQIALDLAACVLLAAFVRRISLPRFQSAAAHSTLWLAVLCPFTAIYAAEPLTESLTLFTLSLALWSAARFQDRTSWRHALAFTFAVTYAALLRPDGALVGVALVPAVVWGFVRGNRSRRQAINFDASLQGRGFSPATGSGENVSGSTPQGKFDSASTKQSADEAERNEEYGLQAVHKFSNNRGSLAPEGQHGLLLMALICALLALAPFAVWTGRNWHVFHVFQPLAPRYATDPGEDTNLGWQRWVKTWALDFVSTFDIYWNVPDGPIDLGKLPNRAFDSPAQRAETASIVSDYEANGEQLTPAVDARFGQLADERIAAHPLRYYVELPLGRMADMWLRPRVENLPIDLDWWVYSHHRKETRFSWFYAALNAFYLLLAILGIFLRPRLWPSMLAYMVLRSALLCTIEAPEARYTLECFPMLFALGGIALSRAFRTKKTSQA